MAKKSEQINQMKHIIHITLW